MQHAQKKSMHAARLFRFLLLFCLAICLGVSIADHADAREKTKRKSASNQENPRYAALVIDAATGEVLMARNADSIRHPASLTKIMTLYMVFDALKAGRLQLDDRIPISSRAAGMSPSKIGLPAGSSIRVEDAIKAIVTKSANDISAAVAENLAGSEKAFAAQMTRRARALGLTRTVFRNASGLPDPQQVTTARDMAKLAIAMMRDHPRYYHYFSTRSFTYRGVTHRNHNRLLNEYEGMDGIKTGFINASGFNLVASAERNGRRLVGVVFGGRSWRSRNDHMVKIMDAGFEQMRRGTDIRQASVSREPPVALPPPLPEEAPSTMGTDMMAATNQAALSEGESEDDVATPQIATTETAIIQAAEPIAHEPVIAATEASGTAVVSAVAAPAAVAPATMTPESRTLTRDERRQLAARMARLHATASRTASTESPASSSINTPETAVSVAAASLENQADLAYAAPVAPATVPSAPAQARPSAQTVMQLRVPADQASAAMRAQAARAQNSLSAWSVQVGAFQSRAMTDQAIRTAMARLPSHLQNGRAVIVPQQTRQGIVFRGRLQGFSEREAHTVCAHLGSCLVVAPGS